MGLGWVVASFDLVPSYFHFGSFHLFISPFSPWFWFAQVIHEDLELFNGELGIDQSYSSHASSPRLLLGIRPSKSRCQHVIHLVGEFGGGGFARTSFDHSPPLDSGATARPDARNHAHVAS